MSYLPTFIITCQILLILLIDQLNFLKQKCTFITDFQRKEKRDSSCLFLVCNISPHFCLLSPIKKDQLVSGEHGLFTTEDEEIFERHERKQRANFESAKKSRAKDKFQRDSFVVNIFQAFSAKKSYLLFDAMRRHYRDQGSGFDDFFKQIPSEDVYLAQYIFSLLGNDVFMSCPSDEYVYQRITETADEGKILFDELNLQ